MNTFTNLGLTPALQAILAEKHISEPTTVQQQAIPLLLQAEEKTRLICIESETGTGKTLAFLLPVIQKRDTSCVQPQILIAAPTKELASQLKTEAEYIAQRCDPPFKTALLIGDAPLKRQIETLKAKPLIVCGTPGRLLELIRLNKLKINNLHAVILDETDRMLAPEMRDDIQELTAVTARCSDIICCSATMKQSYIDIIARFTAINNEPRKMVKLSLPTEDVLRKRITHWAFFAEQRDKIPLLLSFIHAEQPGKALIFTAEAGQVANIVSRLQYKHVNGVAGLHSRMEKQERKQTIDSFRSGKTRILVTSDLTARGLDIPDVTHIIQMDVPSNDDFFVHRAGRTARAGRCGINAVIGTGYEMRLLSKIEKALKIVVYPKIIYDGKISTPETEDES